MESNKTILLCELGWGKPIETLPYHRPFRLYVYKYIFLTLSKFYPTDSELNGNTYLKRVQVLSAQQTPDSLDAYSKKTLNSREERSITLGTFSSVMHQ